MSAVNNPPAAGAHRPLSSLQGASNGLDRLLVDRRQLAHLAGRRVGLLSNEACRTAGGVPATTALASALPARRGGGLIHLFAPEHGPRAAAAAGEAVADTTDAATGLPVSSLYGPRRAPPPEVLAGLDVLVIDLRDVGVRCYTYAATAALAAQAALKSGLDVVVCDRANPQGPAVAGPPRAADLASFLAFFEVPFVHGRTLGALVAATLPAGAHAAIMPADPGARDNPFVSPSPALATPTALALYPGLVLLEATNVSEGRGTSLPFEVALAPWLDGDALARAIAGWPVATRARPVETTPQAGAHAGARCHGIRLAAPETGADEVFAFGVRLLAWLSRQPGFRWREGALPGSDGVRRAVPAIDVLLGNASLRRGLDAGEDAEAILARWRQRATVSPST
ncbi:MAG: DUF1343 domain-containing protein [Alphaproteobacteria bacterium]|nr:DUF1343 domain-containing protein [Alphaproteobacteria bacterium]